MHFKLLHTWFGYHSNGVLEEMFFLDAIQVDNHYKATNTLICKAELLSCIYVNVELYIRIHDNMYKHSMTLSSVFVYTQKKIIQDDE